MHTINWNVATYTFKSIQNGSSVGHLNIEIAYLKVAIRAKTSSIVPRNGPGLSILMLHSAAA